MTRLLFVAFAISLSAAAQQSAGNRPMLRVETGMHTAMINRIAVDANERFAVTASDDKTVRVWDLASGRLLNILRTPIDDGDQGKLYAVALSPDGNTVATGGWTGPSGQNKAVYLLDRSTGRMIARVAAFPNVVNHLAYSADGRFLAVTLGGNNGVRVIRTSDNTVAGQDTAYGTDTYWADFFQDRAGQTRLVTASYDGFVRLYSVTPAGALSQLAKTKPLENRRPFSAAFSRDGSRIAVGYTEGADVRVLSGRDLTFLYQPDTTRLGNDIAKVSWTYDGALLASGKYGDPTIIARWERLGQGPLVTWPVTPDTIMHVVPLRSGNTLYASADPAWGVVNSAGKRIFEVHSQIADFRGQREVLAISTAADAVRFGYQLSGRVPAVFSTSQRTIMEGAPTTGYAAASLGAVALTNWRNEYGPKLNGRPLKISEYERSRSAATSSQGDVILLGTEWNVRCYDRTGTQKWEVPAASVTWAVNVTASGKIGVAAFADGTIRWYRMADGKELLAFFPHADRRRWILWTPAGYYDASPGGEDLIGWHVNNGLSAAADFFPASRFRSTYYRPDVISRILTTLNEDEALRLADAELNQRRRQVDIARVTPPVVRILSPTDGTTVSTPEVTLRYQVRSSSGEPITGVRILVDGRPIETPRAFAPSTGDIREARVTIPRKNSEISLIAENRFAASEPAMLRLRWQGEQEQFTIKPKLYVLAIGINYAEPYRLAYPAKDAQDFVAAVSRQKGLLYREVNARLLTNNKATKEEILDGLDWIEKNTTQHDVAMVYLAGHGVNDTNGVYYYLPMGFDAERLKRTGVAFSDIRNTVQAMAGKVVFFVDTCHSGNVLGARTRSMASDVNAFVNELSSAENGAVVFAASTGRQLAMERDEWGNGAFTKALLEGLSGKADFQSSGKITVNMLDLYVSERVKQLTGGRQTPATTKPKTISDFPVAVRQ